MTGVAARRIYEVARKTDRRDFRIEDMLYTGIFRQKAKINDIEGMENPVCAHYQYMKQNSNDFEKYANLYNKQGFYIQPLA